MTFSTSIPTLLILTALSCGRTPDTPDLSPDLAVDAGPSVDTTPADLTVDQPPCIGGTGSCADGWCTITPGCFYMGSPGDERCKNEFFDAPPHRVVLTHGFRIQQNETTRNQYLTNIGVPKPSPLTTCPTCAVGVMWHAAAAYCNELSRRENLPLCYYCLYLGGFKSDPTKCIAEYIGHTMYDCPGYRLPTEAEWEYAYRAGTTTALYDGPLGSCDEADANANAIAWYNRNTGVVREVGQKLANAWGLHDMAGNVAEWCNDHFGPIGPEPVVDPSGMAPEDAKTGDFMMRGGSYISNATDLRAGARGFAHPTTHAGIRCVRTVFP